MSVKATQGNVDVASFQLESKIGTFQLDVQVLQAAAVPISHGCTAVAQALAPLLIAFKSDIASCFQLQVLLRLVVSAKSFISKSEAE